ncbi:MAG: 3'(2'),5'-bisphosphate nucleotidase CysQ [Bacteroidales bacterium]|nr:3'(2'),5'-bisphosphate nucleotidase CysQ [Bacteroidales bacterium]
MVKIPDFAKTKHIELIEVALEAGQAIMNVFNTDFEIINKSDNSPVTKADFAANDIISRYLKKTNIPIISEENSVPLFDERKKWKEFWIIDPLDGTKEFIRKGTDFTVNIARVVDKIPIEAYIYAPATKTLYWAEEKIGAFKYTEKSGLQVLPISKPAQKKIVVSKSHYTDSTKQFINIVNKHLPNIETVHIGSSLKFCIVAEGNAMLYPRIGSINEWDIAAGDAIVRASGAHTISINSKLELIYNSHNLKTPDFVVGTDMELSSKVVDLFRKAISF